MKTQSEPIRCPFTVLIDSQESQPYTFQNIVADADQDNRPVIVPTRWLSLGRHPNSLGDYSLEGFTGRCHVERKSLEDCQGTVLGFASGYERDKDLVGRRERFKKELENLSAIEAGIVIVEATLPDCMKYMPSWGKRTSQENAKAFFRAVVSWNQRYKVNWVFCDSRRMAEIATFRYLEFFYKRHKHELKDEGRKTA